MTDIQLHRGCENIYQFREHSLPQRVFRSPQMPNINTYSAYKMALLCVLYIIPSGRN